MNPWVLIGFGGLATILVAIRAAQSWLQPIGQDWLLIRELLIRCGQIQRPTDVLKLEKLKVDLACAGLHGPQAIDLFLAARTITMVAGMLIGILLYASAGSQGMRAILFGSSTLIGYLIPLQFVRARAVRRRGAILKALPAAVDLLVTCMDAGLGLEHALRRVAQDIGHNEPILAQEFLVVTSELETGVPVKEAMRRLSRRVGLEELDMFCAVIGHASLLGSSLGTSLREYASSLRRRRMSDLEESAGKSGAKLSLPLALFLLPAAAILIIGPSIVSIARTFAGGGP